MASQKWSSSPHFNSRDFSSLATPTSGTEKKIAQAEEEARDLITVLVVDDEPSNRESLEQIFLRENMRVLLAPNAARALELLRTHRIHVLLTDLMMPKSTGLELLRASKQVAPDVEVVLMTAYGTVEAAVSAMKEGAYDFVEKPLRRASIIKSVKKAAERGKLIVENEHLRREIKLLTKKEMVGHSPVLKAVLDVAHQAAPSHATVLILGESGTGKELMARTIHERSSRSTGPFIAVNCAAIPETILESELFGHERGAFTGALSKKDGRFAKAAGGTLFLDEIGEISLQVQVKLLRVLQEAEYEPIGGDTVKSDVRLIAATNRDLYAEVQVGRFREDLYYRLNVISLTCPPLRARREDIPLLVDFFLVHYCAKNRRPMMRVSEAAMSKLSRYSFPGNVRELENMVERAVVLAKGDILLESDLPNSIRQENQSQTGGVFFEAGITLAEIELKVIRETLSLTKGDKALAAQLLGISARTIYRKLDGTDEMISDDPVG